MLILPCLNTSNCSPLTLVQCGSPVTVAGERDPPGEEEEDDELDDDVGALPPVKAAVGAGVGEGVGGV